MTHWDRPCYSSSLLQGRHAISYNINHRTWKFKQNTRVWIGAMHFRLQQLTKSIASLRFDTSSALGCLILICWTCKSYLRKRKEKSYERFDRNPGRSRAVKKGKRHGNVRPKNSRYRVSVEDEENKSFSI